MHPCLVVSVFVSDSSKSTHAFSLSFQSSGYSLFTILYLEFSPVTVLLIQPQIKFGQLIFPLPLFAVSGNFLHPVELTLARSGLLYAYSKN